MLLDDVGRLDPYAVLEIPFLAPKSRIREAFLDLARREHPDTAGGYESLEWIMGSWAYRTLTDTQSRASYDTARVLRRAMSLTEGVLAFGFSVLMDFGNFMLDAGEVIGKIGGQAWAAASRQLNGFQQQQEASRTLTASKTVDAAPAESGPRPEPGPGEEQPEKVKGILRSIADLKKDVMEVTEQTKATHRRLKELVPEAKHGP